MAKKIYEDGFDRCIACNGSGYYDSKGSPKCSSCKGTGKQRCESTEVDLWFDNNIQFARLLGEMNAVVDFNEDQKTALCESMDLEWSQICELLDRAQEIWDIQKTKI